LPWFRVDDSAHKNSKIRKVAAKAPAALALWTIAGSWSMDQPTGGLITDDDLPWLIPGAEELATELVAARLWRRVKGGYQFHDWTDCNQSAEQVIAEREAAKERMRRIRSGEQRKGSPERSGERGANFGAPSTSYGSTKRGRAKQPPATATPPAEVEKCPEHPGNNATNCGPCRGERLGKS